MESFKNITPNYLDILDGQHMKLIELSKIQVIKIEKWGNVMWIYLVVGCALDFFKLTKAGI